MAGTLTISTLSDGTNSTSSTNCIQGSAKAWVNFDGTATPPSIRGSYNVSSITRNATGDYTVTYTSTLANANYCVSVNGSQNDAGGGFFGNVYGNAQRITTSVRVQTLNSALAYTNMNSVQVIIVSN